MDARRDDAMMRHIDDFLAKRMRAERRRSDKKAATCLMAREQIAPMPGSACIQDTLRLHSEQKRHR